MTRQRPSGVFLKDELLDILTGAALTDLDQRTLLAIATMCGLSEFYSERLYGITQIMPVKLMVLTKQIEEKAP